MHKAHRMTTQRRVILEELRDIRFHPTADELYERVRLRLPRISLGTVYRNLEVLATQGAIQKLETAGGQRRFDGMSEPHYHIRCIQCGTIGNITIQPPLPLEDRINGASGYEICGVRLEVIGICPECLERGRGAK